MDEGSPVTDEWTEGQIKPFFGCEDSDDSGSKISCADQVPLNELEGVPEKTEDESEQSSQNDDSDQQKELPLDNVQIEGYEETAAASFSDNDVDSNVPVGEGGSSTNQNEQKKLPLTGSPQEQIEGH